MKEKIQKLWVERKVVILLVFFTLISLCVSYAITSGKLRLASINENQMLYTLSAISQILGTIYGLTLTAYTFYSNWLKNNKTDDFQDAAESLLQKRFSDFKAISVCVFFNLASCIYGMLVVTPYTILHVFLLNFSVCMFFVTFLGVLYFGVHLLNPNNLKIETDKLSIDAKEKLSSDKDSGRTVSTSEFLLKYLELERYLIQHAMEIADYPEGSMEPSVFDSIKILQKSGQISHENLEALHYLRKYRNGLVHGTNLEYDKIPCSIYDMLCKMVDKIN